MKYLKLFNEELNPQTYRSAASKLKKLGHTKRSNDLERHAKDVESQEVLDRWINNIDTFKEYGVFKFDFHNATDVIDANTKKVNSKLGTKIMDSVEFYLDISFSDDVFDCLLAEGKEGGAQFSGSIPFFVGGVPINVDEDEKCEKFPCADFSNGFYWIATLNINFDVRDAINFTSITIDEYDRGQTGYPVIRDRKTANNLKNLLYNIFAEKIDYPSGYTDITNMYDKIEHAAANFDLISEYNFSMERVAQFIKSVPVNQLYKE